MTNKRVLILDNSRPKLEIRRESDDENGDVLYVINPGGRKYRHGYKLIAEIQDELKQLKCIHLRLEVERQLSKLSKASIFL